MSFFIAGNETPSQPYKFTSLHVATSTQFRAVISTGTASIDKNPNFHLVSDDALP